MTGPTWEIREGDALERLREMPDESIQCCVTSPPYFGLRDYGIDRQIGLEPTPDEFVVRLVEVFREVRRVLRRDGTLWLNIGDSYAANRTYQVSDSKHTAHDFGGSNASAVPAGCKPKDLLGVPWLLAFALRADGWYLRSDIIWAKPNPMPESMTDRPTSAHEHVFLLAKSARYFYDADAIREEGVSPEQTAHNERYAHEYTAHTERAQAGIGIHSRPGPGGRNKRNVWEIATQPYPDAHFATFPPKLVEPCILAGSSPQACGECGAPWRRIVEVEGETARQKLAARGESASAQMGRPPGHSPQGLNYAGGHGDYQREMRTVGWRPTCVPPGHPAMHDGSGHSVILDPFAGAGTTGLVALRHGRSFIGIELNPAYAEMARNRIRDDAPLLNTPAEVAA